MTLGRIRWGINKTEDRHDERANLVRRCVVVVLPTTLAIYLQFRDWIRQETLLDLSSVTFDVRQCAFVRSPHRPAR